MPLSGCVAIFSIAMMALAGLARAADADQAKTIPEAKLDRATPVDFQSEVLPILRSSCLACHNRTKAKASLVLETPADIRKGGDSGPAAVPHKAEQSLLLKAARHDPSVDSPMPPPENKVNAPDLTSAQLGLIRLWIDQGAAGEVRGDEPIAWKSIARSVRPIYAVAISPNGKEVACGRANEIFIYRLPKGRPIARLSDPALKTAHRDMVESLAFSPDGTLLASGSYREVKLWRGPDEWKLDQTAGGDDASSPFSDRVTALDFSPDGLLLATGGGPPSRDGEILLLDVPSMSVSRRLESVHSDAVFSLRFSPDGKRLASGSADKFVRITDVETGKVIHSLEGHAGHVLGVAWKRDGHTLASAGADGTLRIWNADAGEKRGVISGFDKEITSVCFLGDTDQLVAASGDPKVRLVREKGDEIRSYAGASDFVDAVAATPDGKLIVAGGQDGILRIWDARTGRLTASCDQSQ